MDGVIVEVVVMDGIDYGIDYIFVVDIFCGIVFG